MTEAIIKLRDEMAENYAGNRLFHPTQAGKSFIAGFNAAIALCEREKEIAILEAKADGVDTACLAFDGLAHRQAVDACDECTEELRAQATKLREKI